MPHSNSSASGPDGVRNIALVIEDLPSYRAAIEDALRTPECQPHGKWSVWHFHDARRPYRVEEVREWIHSTVEREKIDTADRVLALIDLSWQPSPNTVRASWLGAKHRVAEAYLKLLLCPELLQPFLQADFMADGLALLSPQTRLPTPIYPVVLSAFGVESVRLLAERRGAAYTIQKIPDLASYYGWPPNSDISPLMREAARIQFESELSAGLKRLQCDLLRAENGPLLKYERQTDGDLTITLDLEHLPDAFRETCFRSLRQLYHCPVNQGLQPTGQKLAWQTLREHPACWDSVPLDAAVLRAQLRAVMDLVFEPARHKLADRERVRFAAQQRSDIDRRVVGESAVIRELRGTLRRVAELDEDLLLMGESGVGKTTSARLIHDVSYRRGQPFVRIDGAELRGNVELANSRLRGHVKGAFTGADREKTGDLVRASGGTVFIDQLEYLSFEVQSILVGVLDEPRVTRLGDDSGKEFPYDVRFIFATNIDLDTLIAQGRIDAPLRSRISRGLTLWLPAIRDRASSERARDIELLAHSLVAQNRVRLDPSRLRREHFEVLAELPWPENVRTLQGVLSQLRVLSDGREAFTVSDIRKAYEQKITLALRRTALEVTRSAQRTSFLYEETVKQLILDAGAELVRRHAAVSYQSVADLLGIAKNTLWGWVKPWKDAEEGKAERPFTALFSSRAASFAPTSTAAIDESATT